MLPSSTVIEYGLNDFNELREGVRGGNMMTRRQQIRVVPPNPLGNFIQSEKYSVEPSFTKFFKDLEVSFAVSEILRDVFDDRKTEENHLRGERLRWGRSDLRSQGTFVCTYEDNVFKVNEKRD